VDVTVGIPVKPFADAKRRLAAVYDGAGRRGLAMALAERTVGVVAATSATPLVLSADEEVTAWALDQGVAVLLDEGSSYVEAAAAAVSHIRRNSNAWAILPADLPIVTDVDVQAAVDVVATGGVVLAPSSDGGTSMIGGSLDEFAFSFGPASFHRHLARLAHHSPVILARPGLLLDLDHPADLDAARRATGGSWLSG